MNAKGLKHICRAGFAGRRPLADYPIANRFDEVDTLLVFDDVLIPWEDVLFYRHTRAASFIRSCLHRYSAFAFVQRVQRLAELMIGTALFNLRQTGLEQQQAVREKLAVLACYRETINAHLTAAIAAAEPSPAGLLMPNQALLYSGRVQACSQLPAMMHLARELCGGQICLTPDWASFAEPGDRALARQVLQRQPGLARRGPLQAAGLRARSAQLGLRRPPGDLRAVRPVAAVRPSERGLRQFRLAAAARPGPQGGGAVRERARAGQDLVRAAAWSEPSRRAAGWPKRLGLALTLLLVAVGGAEILLRLRARAAAGGRGDPAVLARARGPRRSRVGRERGGRLSHAGLGRGPDRGRPDRLQLPHRSATAFAIRRPGRPQADIVVLGDSLAFGFGVDDEHSWVAQLDRRLPDHTVVNLGILAAAPQQYLMAYEAHGARLEPELILVALYPPNALGAVADFDDWVAAGKPERFDLWRARRNRTTRSPRSSGRCGAATCSSGLYFADQDGHTLGFADGGRIQLAAAEVAGVAPVAARRPAALRAHHRASGPPAAARRRRWRAAPGRPVPVQMGGPRAAAGAPGAGAGRALRRASRRARHRASRPHPGAARPQCRRRAVVLRDRRSPERRRLSRDRRSHRRTSHAATPWTERNHDAFY